MWGWLQGIQHSTDLPASIFTKQTFDSPEESYERRDDRKSFRARFVLNGQGSHRSVSAYALPFGVPAIKAVESGHLIPFDLSYECEHVASFRAECCAREGLIQLKRKPPVS